MSCQRKHKWPASTEKWCFPFPVIREEKVYTTRGSTTGSLEFKGNVFEKNLIIANFGEDEEQLKSEKCKMVESVKWYNCTR